MKKLFSIVTLAAVMAASCNTNPKTSDAAVPVAPAPDTVGLAKFQQWKAQNELASVSEYNANAPATTQPETKTIVKYYPVKSKSASSSSSGSINSSSSNTATAKKKGWSKAAKGAVIGGVGGAVVGGVLDKKNRGAGAVIGGVLGAGAGYGIGRSKDKKDGRN